MTQNSEIYSFFPSLLQVTEINEAEELNKTFMAGVEKVKKTEPNTKPDSWACTVYTTINSPKILLEYEEFEPLRDIIMREATKFAKVMMFDLLKQPLILNECWLNVYGPSDSQEAHVHGNHVLSGNYYVKAPEGCGEFLLHSPYADTMFNPPYSEMNELNMTAAPIQPKDGLMLMFRSFLKHSVKPSQCKEERVGISFNLTV